MNAAIIWLLFDCILPYFFIAEQIPIIGSFRVDGTFRPVVAVFLFAASQTMSGRM
jgi:hypothetical protein